MFREKLGSDADEEGNQRWKTSSNVVRLQPANKQVNFQHGAKRKEESQLGGSSGEASF